MKYYGSTLIFDTVTSSDIVVGYTISSPDGLTPDISGGSYKLPYPIGDLGQGLVVKQDGNNMPVLGFGAVSTDETSGATLGKYTVTSGGIVTLSSIVTTVRAVLPGTIKLAPTSSWQDNTTQRLSIKNASSGIVSVLVGDDSNDFFDDGSVSVDIPSGTGISFEKTGDNIYSVFLGPGGGASASYDSDAQAYFDRASGAIGATFSLTAKGAVSRWFASMKAAELLSKMQRVNLFAADTLAGALSPAIVTAGDSLDTNVGFDAEDYNVTVGLQGDLSTKYLKTGLIASGTPITSTNSMLAAYMTRTSDPTSLGFSSLIGGYADGGFQFALGFGNSSDPLGTISFYNGNTQVGSLAPRNYKGFYAATSNTDGGMVYKGNEVGNAGPNSFSGSECSRELYVMGRNVLGTPDTFCDGAMAFYAIGTGLTQNEMYAFANITEQFQADMGRKYVPPKLALSLWGDSMTQGLHGKIEVSEYPAGRPVRNMAIGGQTSTQIVNRFLADPAGKGDVTILWVGTNNPGDHTLIMSEIASVIATLTTSKYLIIPPVLGTNSDFFIGTPSRALFDALLNDILTTYPNNSLDLFTPSVAMYNAGIPQDVIDHNHGIVPSSLRADDIHFTGAHFGWANNTIISALVSKGW
jgi:hypothetical protein